MKSDDNDIVAQSNNIYAGFPSNVILGADTFCDNPDLVASVERYAWGAGVYFWMESQKVTPGLGSSMLTCHQAALVHGSFGGTLDIVNGAQECPVCLVASPPP